MVWPRTSAPPGRRSYDQFRGTLLGVFYLRKGKTARNLYSSRYSIKERQAILRELDGYRYLKDDVIVKLSKLSYVSMRKLIFLWRGIENAIVLSTPELIGAAPTDLLWALWRWVVSTAVHNPSTVINTWKKFCLYLKHKVANSDQQKENKFPTSLPGRSGSGMGILWYDTLHWLKSTWIRRPELQPKRFFERVGQLCQHRQLPAPDERDDRFLREVQDFHLALTKVKEVDPKFLISLRKVARHIGERVKGTTPVDKPHVSLSLSASRDYPRSKGGGGVEFCKSFQDKYIKSVPRTLKEGTTLFGAPYRTLLDRPRGYTMCRASNIKTEFKRFMDSSIWEGGAPGSPLGCLLGLSDYLCEPSLGMDYETGYQFIEHAIEECVEKGYIDVNPSDLYSTYRPGKVCIPARAHAVREPGDKLRWVTMEPACCKVMLQPTAHFLAGYLGNYGPLVSAFSRSYKGYDFASMLCRLDPSENPEPVGLGTFDLTAASNNLARSAVLETMTGFLEGLELDPVAFRFHMICINIALQDRMISVYKTDPDRVFEERKTEIKFRAREGLLMGNPITKEALCLLSAVLHQLTYYENRSVGKIPKTLIAGDDIIVASNHRFFSNLILNHRKAGNIINVSKTLWSEIVVFFCEEVIAFNLNRLIQGRYMPKAPYDEICHVDVIKLRLLSPFGIESAMNNPSFRNPAPGKGNALRKVTKWFPHADIALEALRRYFETMESRGLIPSDPLTFVPVWAGGHGLPSEYTGEELIQRLVEEAHPLWWLMMSRILSGKAIEPWMPGLLRRMSTGGAVRGLIDPTFHLLIEQYTVQAFQMHEHSSKTFDQLKKEYLEQVVQTDDPEEYSPFDKVRRFAKRQGLMSWMEIAHSLDRVTTLYATMCAANGALEISRLVPDRDENIPSPGHVLESFIKNEFVKSKTTHLEPSPNQLNIVRDWVNGGMKDVMLPHMAHFVPRHAVRSSVNGLSTPIPYVPPSTPVPGSEADEYATPCSTQRTGIDNTVIFLNRLHGD